MTRVRTNDGHVTEVPDDLIQMCSTLKMATEMTDSCDSPMMEVPLPNINEAIMNTVVRFFESKTVPEFTEPREVFPLYEAADYLGYDNLQDAVAKSIAETLKGKDAEYIRDVFGLERTE
jgi:hypothetical protein